jgi:tetratricopeptide (TPR) repeat protein
LELGWIQLDRNHLNDARRTFEALLTDASNGSERAVAYNALGFVLFAEERYIEAEQQFRSAHQEYPHNEYRRSLAWSLARQDSERSWDEAEDLIFDMHRQRESSPADEVCLGVIAVRRGSLAAAEHHFRRAIEIDHCSGSHTDLGALLALMGRHDEAEQHLRAAVSNDPFDITAHVELGALHLQQGESRRADAERELRHALALDADNSAAAVGLAQALVRSGRENEAEAVLQRALARRTGKHQWRANVAVARMLVERGDKLQDQNLYIEAYPYALKAIELAPDFEADPHFIAGVTQHRIGATARNVRSTLESRRKAIDHLRHCLQREPGNADAQRSLNALESERSAITPESWGGHAIAFASMAMLAVMWVAFFIGDKVTVVMVSTMTPVLVGMFTVATLLPSLIKLKLPGFEANLEAGLGAVAPGPTGDVTFGPGRLALPTGPAGRIPRHK